MCVCVGLSPALDTVHLMTLKQQGCRCSHPSTPERENQSRERQAEICESTDRFFLVDDILKTKNMRHFHSSLMGIIYS